MKHLLNICNINGAGNIMTAMHDREAERSGRRCLN